MFAHFSGMYLSKDIVKEKFHLKNSLTKSDFKNTSGSK